MPTSLTLIATDMMILKRKKRRLQSLVAVD